MSKVTPVKDFTRQMWDQKKHYALFDKKDSPESFVCGGFNSISDAHAWLDKMEQSGSIWPDYYVMDHEQIISMITQNATSKEVKSNQPKR